MHPGNAKYVFSCGRSAHALPTQGSMYVHTGTRSGKVWCLNYAVTATQQEQQRQRIYNDRSAPRQDLKRSVVAYPSHGRPLSTTCRLTYHILCWCAPPAPPITDGSISLCLVVVPVDSLPEILETAFLCSTNDGYTADNIVTSPRSSFIGQVYPIFSTRPLHRFLPLRSSSVSVFVAKTLLCVCLNRLVGSVGGSGVGRQS